MFYEKTKKQKDQKKKGREPDVEGQRVICCATTTNSEGAVKLILNSFAHENLPVDAVWRRKSYIDEELKDIFQENKHGFDS